MSYDIAKISDVGCAVKMEGMRTVIKRNNGGTAVYRPPEMLHGEGFDSTVNECYCVAVMRYFSKKYYL